MDDATPTKPCPTCGGTGLVQSYVQYHGPGRPPSGAEKPVTTRCPDCAASWHSPKKEQPGKRVVCLCGSTKFKRAFHEWSARLALIGQVPLTVSMFSHADGIALDAAQVQQLNAAHARRIALADEIFVLDVGGYIGEGTKTDIGIAERLGKPVRYLSKEHPDWTEDSCLWAGPLMKHPFPGADAHPDKRGGELCVENTRVPVARILAELAEERADPIRAYFVRNANDLADDFGIDWSTVQRCLRGLADWLKTQKWCSR